MVRSKLKTRGRGPDSRRHHVYEALVERIRSGELRAGTRIREGDVARALHVSRTPVREALARLQARGLVESSAAGVSIAGLTRSQVIELYDMRAVLESSAARFAAQNATSADQAELQHAARAFENCTGSINDVAYANKIFHEVILEAAHNRYLTRMLEDLNDSLALLPDTTFSLPGRSAAAFGEHQTIVAAIMARDADAAERAARKHMELARDARLELMFRRR